MINRMKSTKAIFILYCFIGIVLYITMLIASDGRFMEKLLLNGGMFFDDLTKHLSASYTYDNIYEGGRDMCFPPLSYVFYVLLGRIVGNAGLKTQADIVRNGTALLVCVSLLVSNVVMIVASFLCCFEGSMAEKIMLAFILPLSFPFIIAINQGNGIMIVVPLVIGAVYLRNSKDRLFRELALIMLAVAAGFKIYLAILGVIWIKEKRWKEAARLVLYGILFFFVPYVFFDGIDGFLLHLRNVRELGGIESLTSLESQDITAMVMFVCKGFLTQKTAYMIGKILSYVYFAVIIFIFFVSREDWKSITLLTSLMIIFVAPSNSYTYLYLLMPLLLFFEETSVYSVGAKEAVYAVLWGMIFVFWPVVIFRAYLMTASVYLMFVLLATELVFEYVKTRINNVKMHENKNA